MWRHREQRLLGDDEVGQAEKAAQLCLVLGQPFVANLLVMEQVLDRMERVLHPSPNLRLHGPIYRLHASVKVRSGKKVPRSGLYLPEADDSCAQVMVQDYEAWGVNIGYNPSTMQRISTQATTWTLVSERVANSGGDVPVRPNGAVASASGNTIRMRCDAGQGVHARTPHPL